MAKKRVLMLGPGEPSISNSGLGKSADQISRLLSEEVQLTIIQPDQLESITEEIKNATSESKSKNFSDFVVLSDMAKVSVAGNIDPYWRSMSIPGFQNAEDQTVQDDHVAFSNQIVEEAENVDFDVIYAHDWLTFKAAIEIKEASKKPLVVHVHSLDYDRNAMYTGSWVFQLEKDAFEIADKIICVSQYSKRIIEQEYGIDGSKIEVVYNGFEHASYPEYKNPYQEKIVLFVGRLTGQKGPTQFLEIAERVHEKDPNTRFIMAGHGEMYKTLIEAGAHSIIAHKFHMTGYLDKEELLKLYAMSDVYCMPSVSEPFGLTAIEAAGAGLPQVISKNSGAAEVLDGVITVDFNDAEGFANEIVRFLHNGSHRKNCVHLSQSSLHALTWEKAGEEVLGVLSNA